MSASKAKSVSDPDVEGQPPNLLSDSATDVHVDTESTPPYSIEDALRRDACAYSNTASTAMVVEHHSSAQVPSIDISQRHEPKRKCRSSPAAHHTEHVACLLSELPSIPVEDTFALARYTSSHSNADQPSRSDIKPHLKVELADNETESQTKTKPRKHSNDDEEVLAMIGGLHNDADRCVFAQTVHSSSSTDTKFSNMRDEPLAMDEDDEHAVDLPSRSLDEQVKKRKLH